MASTKTSKARPHHSPTKTGASTSGISHTTASVEDLGYFYDTIHGRVAFGELPVVFQPALRAALSSAALDRLTRISQLGHTSLTYFSATQTRFSHAIGTLLMMNRLFSQLWPGGDLPNALLAEVKKNYPGVFNLCKERSACVRCHLLLVALYQDCGELPFQKVTSLYFRPHPNELDSLRNRLTANPEQWKSKDVFTLRSLCEDLERSDLRAYDLNFLAFLITGADFPSAPHLRALRQMVDGTIDADRLDYVFRDALLTIGSLGRAETVLRSIVRYENDYVVVNDPRPAVDFLSTRARLWTFVYASPDVRFRQTLLKSFLQAGFGTEEGRTIFAEEKFPPEVTLDEFLELDDHSMLLRMRRIRDRDDFGRLAETGRNACEGLLKTVTDYECRILSKARPNAPTAATPVHRLPNDLFFDLMLDQDEEHKLYVPKSVRVEHSLTDGYHRPGESMCLEECCGAIGPVFSSSNRAPLVRDSFLLFRPRTVGSSWGAVDKAIQDNTLYATIDREDVRREIAFRDDTWNDRAFRGQRVGISCSFQDRPTVVRIIRQIQAQKQKYRILLDSMLGLSNTSLENSRKLIQEADAILVIASSAYINSAVQRPGGNIDAEVQEIFAKSNTGKVVVVLPVDSYETLKTMPNWAWSRLNGKWTSGPPVLSSALRHAGETMLRDAVTAAIRELNGAST